MIEKPSIIFTSLGRTGTKFFYRLFEALLPHSTVLHEPDVWNIVQYRGTAERLRQMALQVRQSGLANMTLGRLTGRWGLFPLADGRFCRRMPAAEAARRLEQQRRRFITSRPGRVYVESSAAYYGLIDIMPAVFSQYRLVFLVRDGRDWVRSKMNWGEMYGKGRLRRLVAHNWPTARGLPGDAYGPRWHHLSRFERVCWAWDRLNRYALATLEGNPQARLARFEDVFLSPDRYQQLQALLDFVTGMPGVPAIPPGAAAGWLERRVHRSQGTFPAWEAWPESLQQTFAAICGPLMAELGYALEARAGTGLAA